MRYSKYLSVLVMMLMVGVVEAQVRATATGARDANNNFHELPRAQAKDVGLDAKKLKEIDEVVNRLIEEQKIAGAVTVVVRKGKVVQAEAYGYADLETKKKMQMDTIFRIYSMTKPIVSVATMMLVEEGKVKLDDPVSKYIPEFKGVRVYDSGQVINMKTVPADREPTIADLLRHTSGLTYGFMGNTPVDRMYRRANVLGEDRLEDLGKKLGNIPLQYQPGTKWLYSVSVDVLGRVVEVGSGKKLDVFLKERIFKPLLMVDTGYSVPADKVDRFATNYGPKLAGNGLRVVDDVKTSKYLKRPVFFSGGGGLVSTIGDYVRFCQMLMNGGTLDGARILKAKTVKMMTKNQLPKPAYPIGFGNSKRKGVGFGFGFSVRVEADGEDNRIGEYGWGGAASTHFWVSPADDLFVVTMSQHMPYTDRMERLIKPIVYDALK